MRQLSLDLESRNCLSSEFKAKLKAKRIEEVEIFYFRLRGKAAHFRQVIATTTRLTYLIPPPTVVFGMLGAVIGLERWEYLKHLNGRNTAVGVRFLGCKGKEMFGVRFLNAKRDRDCMQVRVELLRSPGYEVYVYVEEWRIFEKLVEKVIESRTEVPLFLGAAFCPAVLEKGRVCRARYVGESSRVDSSVLEDDVVRCELTEENRFVSERMPVDLDWEWGKKLCWIEERKVERKGARFGQVLTKIRGGSFLGRFKNVYEVKGEEGREGLRICFLSGRDVLGLK